MKNLWFVPSVRRVVRPCVFFSLFLTIIGFGAATRTLQAQNAHFAGAQTAVGSGFSAPAGIAVDAAGNVYVADSGAGKVIRIPATDPTCSTLSDCTSVGTGLVHPRSVVLDASGNVYIADQGTNLVTKVLATDLTCATAGDCTNVGPALSSPEGVAVDANNNVYIADEGNARVLYVPAADLSCATPSDCKSVGTGLTAPAGVGVDRLNNIYIADTASTTILKVPSSDLACTTAGDCTTVGSGFSSPFDVAVNFNGDVFVADTGNNRIVKVPSSDLTCATVTDCKTVGFGMNQPTAVALTQFGNVYAADFGAGQALQVQVAGVNLGTINVGSTSGSVALTFTFDASVTLNSTTAYQVLTQGATGLDFKDAGSGTCATSSSFTVGQTCTVNVHFSPASPGLRLGSVALYDSTGNTLATANLFGTGSGPQAVFYPGTQSTILNPIPGAAGVAVDAAGNIYVTSYSLGNLYKITQSGGVYSASTIATGLSTPLGIAVDGMGNVFVATGNGVLKFTPSGGTYTQSSIVARTSYLVGVAVDQYGNIYYTDLTGSAVFRLLLSNGTYTSYSVGTSWAGPYGIAVDPSGNVYVSDYDSHAFYKETLGTNSFYTLSTIFSVASTDYPTSVALDASGNIYAAVLGGSIYRESPSGGGYTQTVVAATTTPPVYDVALDNSGNLYFTYENPSFSTDGLYEINVNGQPPLSLTFNNTAVNATSSDSPQGFSVWNIGNAPLIFTTPGTGTNPSYPTDFPDNSADTQLCTAASPLESAGFCDVSIDFSPLSSGSHNETVTLVDNTLNGTNATQSIAVSGTATGVSITLSPTSLAAETFNAAIAPVTFTAAGGTAPYTFTVVSGSLPPGVTLTSAGALSGTPTSAGSYTFSVQAEDASSNIGSQAYSVTVAKAAPTLAVSNSPVTYTGSAQSATLNPSTPGTVSNVQYNGSSTVPTAAGTYAVTADFAPTDTTNYTSLTGAAAGNFVIGQATPTLAVSNSPVTYSGSAQAATIAPSVPGTVSAVLYNGSSTAPTTVGTYAVSASFTPTDTTNYATLTGAAAGNFVINKATPTLSVSNPSVPYTGSAQAAAVVGSVPGTVSAIMYNGSSTAPTTAGTYAVTASFTPTDTTDYASLTGASAGNFVISKATPTLSVSNPSVPYTGSAQAATVVGSVPGTVSAILYNGSSTTPTTAGTYAVTASFTPTDTTDYATLTGASAGNFVINKATPTLSVSNPSVPYTGSAQAATVVGSVPGTVSAILYNGSSTAPTTVGTYTITASYTPTDSTDYATLTGAAAGTFSITKATPTITWATPAGIAYGTALSSTQLDATSTVAGNLVYTPAAGSIPLAGTQTLSVTLTPTDTTDYNNATQTVQLVVSKAAPSITWATPAAITYGTALGAAQLNASSTVAGTLVYTPAAGTVLGAGTQTLSVTLTPTDAADYATATQTVQLVVNKAAPAITWPAPAAINYGTALSATQLDATSTVAGAFVYTPAAGTVLSAGTQTLSVTLTPTDGTDYTSATQTVQLVVNKAGAPTITWSSPAAITYGTALSATQLDASSTVPGTFVYTPAAGTVLNAGTQTLSVTLNPTDTTDYPTSTQTVQIVVNKATPTVTWATPAAITYGTALSAAQLNASGSVPGTLVYTPAAGTLLTAGLQTLSVTFTPTDSTDYSTVTQTVQLQVNKVAPSITWATPAAITYGTALSATQLDATATVPGTFDYTPSSGTVLSTGTQTLSVTFTPSDTTDYSSVTQTVQLTVKQATAPSITWAAPAAITYGTALGATQLDASATIPGAFVYSPAAGTVLAAGLQTLSVTFTPTDTTDYPTATQTVQITVNKANPSITWAVPAAISYGTALGAPQLDASSTVAGAFVYTPAAGTVLNAGTQTLSVTLTPTDNNDYNQATQTVSLTVNKAAQTITFTPPAAVAFGSAPITLTATGGASGNPVTFTLVSGPASLAGSTLSFTGIGTVVVDANEAGNANYLAATQVSQSINVTNAALTVTANNVSRVYGAANPTFTGSVSGAVNGDAFTETFSTTATASSPVGSYPIVPAVTGTDLADYTVTVQNGTLNVTQAGTSTTLAVSSSSINPGQSVTLTATVASATSGTPTGSVSFYDGSTLLGTGTLASGAATYAAAGLQSGSHTITAVYAGDTNFTGSSTTASTTIVVAALDFTLTVTGGSDETIKQGGDAYYQLQVNPTFGNYPGTVSFTATGLPAGATISFSPSTVPVNGGQQSVTATVVTAPGVGANVAPSIGRKLAPLGLALFLLPLAGARRMRRFGRGMSRLLSLLLLLAGLATAAAVSGCGGSVTKTTNPQTYTIGITATGGNAQHSVNVTLEIN